MSDSPDRIIAFHAHQYWRRTRRHFDGYILLSERDAERLEDALRLARTGKLDKCRTVRVSLVETEKYPNGGAAVTTLTTKGYVPREEPS